MSVSDREADENSLFTGETPSIDTNDIMALSDTAVQPHLMHALLLRC